MAEADAAAAEIVRGHLDDDAVADAGADAEFAHLAGGIGQHLVSVIVFFSVVVVWLDFRDGAVEIEQFFLRHPVVSKAACLRPRRASRKPVPASGSSPKAG